jgi:HAD superfamily hydrolase (TIGR01509 family)
MLIHAAIFDVDGTLVDSNDFHARAWEEAFHKFGNPVTFAEVRQHVGKGTDQLLPFFFSPEQLQRFGKEMEEFRSRLYEQKYRPQVKPFPLVRELFLKLKEARLRIALATSAKPYEVEGNLQRLHITDLVDSITNAEAVKRSKPYPDLFLAAMKALDLPANACVAIGDTPWDGEAARAAGLACIGVTCGGFSEEQLRAAGCERVFRDPAELLEKFATSGLLG